MKVIAKISETVVLCEVTVGEIGRLHGTGGPYDKEWDRKWLDVGAEHDMVEAFKAVETIRGFDAAQFRYMQQRIDTMTEAFGKVKEAYEKLTLLDKLAKE